MSRKDWYNVVMASLATLGTVLVVVAMAKLGLW